MGSAVRRIQIQEYQDTSEQPDRLDWIPVYFEPFLWKPPGLEPADIGWFVNLIEASLKSELQGYLQVEGPETLWRIAGAKHPESWKLHCSKVLAHFERTQMHGHDWLYFPPLVRMIEKQRKKLQGKRSRNPKNPQKSEGGAGFSLPLVFDSDVGIGFKTQQVENVDMDSEAKTPGNMPEEPLKSARRIIDILGMPATDGNLKVIEAAVVAEAAYTGQTFQEAAEQITKTAREDREVGIPINKFYFEDAKWRQSGRQNVRSRLNKAEQRKLDNLEVNARVKQHLQDLLDGS